MTGGVPRVVDLGLQAERTALAWRRTSLALVVAALGAGRLATPVLGVPALLLGAAGLAQAALVTLSAGRRYPAVHRSLGTHGDLRGVAPGGLPLAALACSGLLVAVLTVGFVVAGETGMR